LVCAGCPQLRSLDVSKNKDLRELYCWNCPQLQYLPFTSEELEKLGTTFSREKFPELMLKGNGEMTKGGNRLG